jgi:hypothetical protein
MNESIPSMLQPPQAAQKLRIWFGVSFGFGLRKLLSAVFTLSFSLHAFP